MFVAGWGAGRVLLVRIGGGVMHEEFAEGWRAVGYVSSGITADFGEKSLHHDTLLEVTLHARGKVVRRLCAAHEFGKVATALCQGFPRASVYYHPGSAYGFIAQIRCHCGREASPGCCRAGGAECATVTVVLAREPAPEQRRSRKEAPSVEGMPEDW